MAQLSPTRGGKPGSSRQPSPLPLPAQLGADVSKEEEAAWQVVPLLQVSCKDVANQKNITRRIGPHCLFRKE